MGFAATASYFEDRARSARDPDSQALFREVADFYRKLAHIAPGFPPGFASNKVYSRADRWRQHAEECRAMADHFTDPKPREQMRRLADTYDSMAAAAE